MSRSSSDSSKWRRDDRDFLREQINRKDHTIEASSNAIGKPTISCAACKRCSPLCFGGRRREDPPTYTQ